MVFYFAVGICFYLSTDVGDDVKEPMP